MLPAPPRGRPSKVIEVGDHKFRVTQAPPREAARLAFVLFRSIGKPIVSLLSAGSLALTDTDGHEFRVSFKDAWKSPPQRAHLLGEIAARAQDVDDGIIDRLVEGLLVGKLEISDGETWSTIDSLEDVDDVIPDFRSLVTVIAAALEVTISPFADASTTPGGTSPGKT